MPTLVPSRIAITVVLWSDGPKMETGSGILWRNRANSSSTILAATRSFSVTEPGDNLACFFSSVNNAAVAGGIAGGAVAGIVVACVIAALIAVWASKKGYDYYQAQSQLQSTGAHQNPYFKENTNQGEMPHGRF